MLRRVIAKFIRLAGFGTAYYSITLSEIIGAWWQALFLVGIFILGVGIVFEIGRR